MTGIQSRTKLQRLNHILDNHAAWERRTLADLHVLGYKFPTIVAAFRYRKAQDTLAALSRDELLEFVAEHYDERKVS